jgi:NAD(P)-dependent dehydrogenase (short-subunit alcohol dehydrogenase family)
LCIAGRQEDLPSDTEHNVFFKPRPGDPTSDGTRSGPISSQAGHVCIKRNAAYGASKGGVEMLTKAPALEWGRSGVTVNAVAPGFIRTAVNAEALDRPEFLNEVTARVPVGRVGTAIDVPAAVLFLASPAASFVTGTSVLVDGGWTAQ